MADKKIVLLLKKKKSMVTHDIDEAMLKFSSICVGVVFGSFFMNSSSMLSKFKVMNI